MEPAEIGEGSIKSGGPEIYAFSKRHSAWLYLHGNEAGEESKIFGAKNFMKKLQQILRLGLARVTSLLHVNSIWYSILFWFWTSTLGQKLIFMF